MIKKRIIAASLASLALVVPFFPVAAQTVPDAAAQTDAGWHRGGFMGKGGMHGRPGMGGHGTFGTVTAVSGSTITVTSKAFGKDATETTYTVDATNAKIDKDGVTGAISDIAVGDMIMVQGTVTGTSIAATDIHDGMPPRRDGGSGMMGDAVPGNGQPVVMGTISAVSGSTLTLTNNGGTPFTVETASATVIKDGKTGSLTDVATGDTVVVQGTVNGTSITADTVRDQGTPKTPPTATGTTGARPSHRGFFAGIGGWFAHLFGF